MEEIVTAIVRDGLWHVLYSDISMTRLRDVFEVLDDFAAHEREYAKLANCTSDDRGHRCAYARR